MRFFKGLSVLALWIVLLSETHSAGLAQAPKNDSLRAPVRAAISIGKEKIIPGKPFKIYVDFNMEPGWHIYFKDPGQSGMPTKVEWTFPQGFTAQPLSWPQAETFKEAGIVTYGYSSKVRLSTTVMPSKSLKPGTAVSIKAKTSWLACKHSCVPGESSLSLDLKVQPK